MKRIALFIVFVLLVLSMSAQKKKPQKVLDPVEKIEKDAKEWFKKYYVPYAFKDPYSYRLVKCFAVAVYENEELDKQIKDVKGNIKALEFMKEQKPERYSEIMQEKHKKFIAELEELEKRYNSLSEQQKKSPKEYRVYIHCYAKNSYGNEVLGKYKFTANRDGKFDINNVEDLSDY